MGTHGHDLSAEMGDGAMKILSPCRSTAIARHVRLTGGQIIAIPITCHHHGSGPSPVCLRLPDVIWEDVESKYVKPRSKDWEDDIYCETDYYECVIRPCEANT